MKAATVAQLKKELQYKSQDEVLQLCLRLARFKKENKELLTYLLFESDSEEGYIETVKEELLLYFCEKLKSFRPSINRNTTLKNLYTRQLEYIKKKIPLLHEDLQHDYGSILEELHY